MGDVAYSRISFFKTGQIFTPRPPQRPRPPGRLRRPPPSLSSSPRHDPDEHFLERHADPPELQQIPVLLRGQLEDLGAYVASARGLDHVPGGAVREQLVLTRKGAGGARGA